MQAVDGHVPRKVGLQVRLVPKSNTRRLSYECWQGAQNLHRPGALPAAHEKSRLKKYDHDHDCDGTWLEGIPDGNDHSIEAVRFAIMDDILRG